MLTKKHVYMLRQLHSGEHKMSKLFEIVQFEDSCLKNDQFFGLIWILGKWPNRSHRGIVS